MRERHHYLWVISTSHSLKIPSIRFLSRLSRLYQELKNIFWAFSSILTKTSQKSLFGWFWDFFDFSLFFGKARFFCETFTSSYPWWVLTLRKLISSLLVLLVGTSSLFGPKKTWSQNKVYNFLNSLALKLRGVVGIVIGNTELGGISFCYCGYRDKKNWVCGMI